jgi:hypothetical protein
LKAAAGVAGAKVVAAQFLDQFLVAMDNAFAAFDLGFRRITFATLARDFKSAPFLRSQFEVA